MLHRYIYIYMCYIYIDIYIYATYNIYATYIYIYIYMLHTYIYIYTYNHIIPERTPCWAPKMTPSLNALRSWTFFSRYSQERSGLGSSRSTLPWRSVHGFSWGRSRKFIWNMWKYNGNIWKSWTLIERSRKSTWNMWEIYELLGNWYRSQLDLTREANHQKF